jgi:putative lipoprotein
MRIEKLAPGMAIVGLLLGTLAPACTPAGAGTVARAEVTGTASYRERILLPPEAVFEAVLQDVSRADAPAVEIGRTRIDNPGAPPIAFSIAYDPAAIDPRMTYAVRALIKVDGRLMFTSETLHPVLTRGAPREVSILMSMANRPPAVPH